MDGVIIQAVITIILHQHQSSYHVTLMSCQYIGRCCSHLQKDSQFFVLIHSALKSYYFHPSILGTCVFNSSLQCSENLTSALLRQHTCSHSGCSMKAVAVVVAVSVAYGTVHILCLSVLWLILS